MVSNQSRFVCSTPQPCTIRAVGVEHFQNPLSLDLTYVVTYLLEEEEVVFAIPTLFDCCLVGQSRTPADKPQMFSVPSA